MADETHGRYFTVFDPLIYWADLFTALPARHLPFETPWPLWNQVYDTQNGATVAMRQPEVAIPGDKRGRLGSVAGGDEGVNIGFQHRTPTIEYLVRIAGLDSKVLAPVAADAANNRPAMPETRVRRMTRRKKRIMIGIEGWAEAGSMFEEDTLVRVVLYRGANTANSDMVFRSTGADSAFSPQATFEAEPSIITPAMLTNTGYAREDLDPDGKWNMMDSPVAA